MLISVIVLNRSNGFVCIMFPPIGKLLPTSGDVENEENQQDLVKRKCQQTAAHLAG